MTRRAFAHPLLASVIDAPRVRVRGEASPHRAAPTAARERRPLGDGRRAGHRFYLGLIMLTLAVGALSLLFPSSPSYDPWSWILWAREIIHGQLTITTTGTSWKPLPMLFTIPFALAGSAAPDLWLVVARAGALAAVLLAGRIAWRLTRQLADTQTGPDPAAQRVARTLAPALAAAVAMVALAFCVFGAYISSNALGYSEGLATALMFAALERHLDGHPRQAFAVGFLVALDRPEVWLFWVPYGLWLAWRDRRFAPVVLTALLLQPIVWFVPVYLGSGHFGSSVTRARDPRSNSLAYASNPFLSELWDAAWRTVPLRVKLLAAALTAATGWVTVTGLRRDGTRALRSPRTRTLLTTVALGLAAVVWFVLIAAETQLHFSGNDRYLVLGAALLDVCGAIGFGVLALGLIALGARWARRRGPRRGAAQAWLQGGRLAGAAVAAALAVFLLAPDWIGGGTLISLPALHGELLYQGKLRSSLDHEIAAYGGARRVLACGTVMTEGFQVPMVAYALNVPTTRVQAPPSATGPIGPAPDLVLQTESTRGAPNLPYITAWPKVKYTAHPSIDARGPFSLYTHCPSS